MATIPAPELIPHTQSSNSSSNSVSQGSQGNLFYNQDCSAPFIVHITKNDTSSNSVSNIHPMQISRILKNQQTKGIILVTKVNRNTVKVTLDSWIETNSFVANFQAQNSTFRCYIPEYILLTKGVIKDIPIDFSEEEQYNTIESSLQIYNIKRMFKFDRERNERIPIPMITATFIGSTVPDYVMFDYYKADVRLYIKPITQCNNCLKYGHFSKFFRGKMACRQCGVAAHPGPCKQDSKPTCINCKQAHLPTGPNCPERKTQRKINSIVAEKNISA